MLFLVLINNLPLRVLPSPTDHPSPVPRSPPGSPSASSDLQYEDVLNMVQKLHNERDLITLDNDKIRSVCNQLLKDKKSPGPGHWRPHWLREAWIVQRYSDLDRMLRQSTPLSNRISLTTRGTCEPWTLGSPGRALTPSSMESGSLGRVLRSYRGDTVCLLRHHVSRCESILRVTCRCQSYRPAAPIQRFNNKSLNWPAWFRHFRAVADVHGWHKNQRALQLVSYLDETAMNIAYELGNDELYDYDILVKLLGDWFDPASRVSASRSRFHGWSRRHHEDADSFTDAFAELCHVGYPQSSPELRQELISKQFVRGQ